MNRKTFLATIAGLFAAPFIRRKKIAIPEQDKQWLNANPADYYHRCTITYTSSDDIIVYRMGHDGEWHPVNAFTNLTGRIQKGGIRDLMNRK
jgi:hypothetical protein